MKKSNEKKISRTLNIYYKIDKNAIKLWLWLDVKNSQSKKSRNNYAIIFMEDFAQ